MRSNILIVDDSTVTRRIVRRVIELSDLPVSECLEAANGLEALAILERTPVDVLITDINMPKMNGEELIKEIESHPALRSIPILVLSTDSSSVCIARLKGAGVRAFLSKPFTPEILRAELEKLFASQRIGKNFDSALASAVETVLQTMFFTTVVEPPRSVLEIPSQCVHASIDFSTDILGSLRLSVESRAGCQIAANVFGIDESSVSESQLEDTVCELANVVCGSLLSVLEGQCGFHLQPPTVHHCDEPESRQAVRVQCESGSVFASLTLKV